MGALSKNRVARLLANACGIYALHKKRQHKFFALHNKGVAGA
jgi:hypothetical protein